MKRIKQKYYPEGYFEIIRTKKISDIELDKLIGSSTVVSARVISYIADEKPYLEVDLGNERIGYIYITNNEEIYKNKSLVNEIINFCIQEKIEDKKYLLERNSLIAKARNEILKNYKPGDVLIGKIVAFLGYGAFVDIGWGATALLYKTDITGNPRHPKEVLKRTSYLYVEIKSISEDGNIYVKMI